MNTEFNSRLKKNDVKMFSCLLSNKENTTLISGKLFYSDSCSCDYFVSIFHPSYLLTVNSGVLGILFTNLSLFLVIVCFYVYMYISLI